MSNQSHAHLYGNVSFEARQGAATQEDIDLALGELVLHFPNLYAGHLQTTKSVLPESEVP